GVVANMMPQEYTAQSLADLFPRARSRGIKVLLTQGNRSPGLLERELGRKGYEVTSSVVYTTELRNSLDKRVEQMIYSKEADCIAFTSPSSVRALVSIIGPEIIKSLLEHVTISAIGPSTNKACNDAGLKVEILPTKYTMQGMVREITRFYSKK